MEKTMTFNKITSFVLLSAIFLSFLPSSAPSQVGDPIEISFGQPNIWSLEQAHYLLAQMRERSLRIKADPLKDLDPNSAEASRINLVRQLFGLNGEFKQTPTLPNAASSPSPTPTPLPSSPAFPGAVTEPNQLSNTILSTLLTKEFLQNLNKDSKLNATTMLDNHVQLQYEIIAKQLTLLRDEVGPDERLVFLELPQSIYASANETKGKVAQTYWEIAGYSEFDRKNYLFAGIEKLQIQYKNMKNIIDGIKAKSTFPVYSTRYDELQKAKNAFEVAAKIPCDEKTGSTCKTDNETLKNKFENETKAYNEFVIQNIEFANFEKKVETLNEIGKQLMQLAKRQDEETFQESAAIAKETIERINQNGSIPNNDIIERIVKEKTNKDKLKTSEFGDNSLSIENASTVANRKTRAVDIIPRQSSLNVNDIQETVKSSILGGAFSFLFGLGLRTNYQRQRDTFEQYLHQEIYASGFGKGENVFGWTFGPVPGTKKIAPGVRTTYAVLVVPRKAEALILNARGCFFPRNNFQLPNAMNLDKNSADYNIWKDDFNRECTAKKQYVIPIPNGGDASGFWLTGVDYSPAEKGQKTVVSIKGKNFTSQVGVLVSGVPLQQVVELTRKLPSDDLIEAFCENGICGQYEVIDSEEITMVFNMPKDFEGTPNITVVGPGRAVNLKEVSIKIIAHGTGFNDKIDSCELCKISEKRIPFMFGVRASEKLTISDLQVFPGGASPTALLSGTKFSEFDDIYVNGEIITSKVFIAQNQYKLTVDLKGKDSATVLVKQCQEKFLDSTGKEKLRPVSCASPTVDKDSTVTPVKTFPVTSTQFIITNVSALRYDSDKNEMFVRIEGTGFEGVTLSKLNDIVVNPPPPMVSPFPIQPVIIPVSPREFLVKITNPESVVKITLKNQSGVEINTMVIRPPDIDLLENQQ